MTDLRCALGFHRWVPSAVMTWWIEQRCARKNCKARRNITRKPAQ